MLDELKENGTLTVLGGNMRLRALQELGHKEVWVSVVEPKSEAEKIEISLSDNDRVGYYEDQALAELVYPYREEIDLKAFKVDLPVPDVNLSDILSRFAPESEKNLDNIPQEVEPVCKRGQIWQLGKHRLMCGDSTKREDTERLMEGKKADMVFTDPPYNALKSWNKDEAHSETRLDPSTWFANDNMEWPEYKRFLTSAFGALCGHSIYVCSDYRVYPLVIEIIEDAGFDLKHCIVWKKNVWTLGKRYRFQHEFVVYACKGNAPFYGDRAQSDVWEIDVDKSHLHNTQKPVELSNRAITNSSQIDNALLDMFLGSGTTLIACEHLNRICYGMEIEPKYCDVTIARWEDLTGKKAKLVEDVQRKKARK